MNADRSNLLTIDSAAAVDDLRTDLRRPGPRRFAGIVVKIPGASEADNAQWQQRIQREYFACGCDLGTAASLLAVSVLIVNFITRDGGLSALRWTDGLLLLGAFVIATGVGKLIGIRLARARLRAVLGELAMRLPAGPARPPQPRHRRRCSVHG